MTSFPSIDRGLANASDAPAKIRWPYELRRLAEHGGFLYGSNADNDDAPSMTDFAGLSPLAPPDSKPMRFFAAAPVSAPTRLDPTSDA